MKVSIEDLRKTKATQQNPVLRQHQKSALSEICKVIRRGRGKGRIVLPTGTGKTRIEAETICEIIKRFQKEEEYPGVHVVLSPRILLGWQQLNEFIVFIIRNGITCQYMMVNSGGLDSGKYEKIQLKLGVDHPVEIVSTTNKSKITGQIISAQRKNIPLVIFSTYHSVGRVDEAATDSKVKINSYIFDEAQYCVTSGDFQHVPNFDSFFKFFFTATEKLTDSDAGLGMNNEDKFGKLIFTLKPRVLIERGEMASVRLHLVGTRGQVIEDNDYESMARVVIQAFEYHRVVMKEHSLRPETIGPKMIVVCDKQDSLRGIVKALREYRLNNPAVNICALSSDFGIEINGIHDPRVGNPGKEKLLEKMRSWRSEDEAIILHVDMIAEGLDVPGITAVMPFRNLGAIKFLQNLGRGTRLIDVDRTSLYSGEITPKDWPKYVKPFCWLVLPDLSSEYHDMRSRYTDVIRMLRADYGFDSNELVVVDNIVGPPLDEPLDDIVGLKKRKHPTGKGLIEEIVQSIESEEAMNKFMEHEFSFNTLSLPEQIRLLRAIYAPQDYGRDESVAFFRKHLKTSGGVESFVKHLMQKGQQNVHTPYALCREVIGKLKEYTKLSDKKIAVLFNIEFLHVLINDFGVNVDNIVMFADDDVEFEFCKLQYKMQSGINLFQIDIEKSVEKEELYVREGKLTMKFDVVTMNPPYQGGHEGEGPGRNKLLWPSFVKKSLLLAKDGGYICSVHPALWRKPEHEIWDLLIKQNLFYLEIHSKQDGERVFGATTRFDWYVLGKTPYEHKTIVRDQSGNVLALDVSDKCCLPNMNIDDFFHICAKTGEETLKIIYSTKHHNQNPAVKRSQTVKAIFPCVHAIVKEGPILYYVEDNSDGTFRHKKVIVNTGDNLYAMLDEKGEYGTTEHCFGILIDTAEEGIAIIKALTSERFAKIIKATKWSNYQLEYKMFKYFRKDFWKEFV